MITGVPLDAGHIVIDVCAYEDGGVVDVTLTLDSLGQDDSPTLHKPKSRRYVLPLGSSATNNEVR